MNVYCDYLTESEKEQLIIESKYDTYFSKLFAQYEMLEMQQEQMERDAELKVLTESGTYDDYEYLMEAASKEMAPKKVGVLRKVLDGIKSLINKIKDAIKKAFAGLKKADGPVGVNPDTLKDSKELKKITEQAEPAFAKAKKGDFSGAWDILKKIALPAVGVVGGATVIGILGYKKLNKRQAEAEIGGMEDLTDTISDAVTNMAKVIGIEDKQSQRDAAAASAKEARAAKQAERAAFAHSKHWVDTSGVIQGTTSYNNNAFRLEDKQAKRANNRRERVRNAHARHKNDYEFDRVIYQGENYEVLASSKDKASVLRWSQILAQRIWNTTLRMNKEMVATRKAYSENMAKNADKRFTLTMKNESVDDAVMTYYVDNDCYKLLSEGAWVVDEGEGFRYTDELPRCVLEAEEALVDSLSDGADPETMAQYVAESVDQFAEVSLNGDEIIVREGTEDYVPNKKRSIYGSDTRVDMDAFDTDLDDLL